MLKRIVFILIAFILCGTTVGITQKIGNYVIGYYIKAYIDKKTDDAWRIEAFHNEWAILNGNTVAQPISQSELEKIIQKLPTEFNKENLLQKTTDFYNEIKDKRNETDIEKLVKLPPKYYEDWLSKSTQKPKFETDQQALRESLQNEINKGGVSPEAQQKNVRKRIKEEANSETIQKETNDKTTSDSSLWWIWLLFGCIGGILVWEFLLRKRIQIFNEKEIKSNNENIEKRSVDKQPSVKIDEQKQIIIDLKKKNKELLEENIKLGKEIDSFQVGSKQSYISDEHMPIENVSKVFDGEIPISATTLYADAIIDGFFSSVKEVPNEDTIFELQLQNAQSAVFVVYASAYQRIIANPSFLEGCDKQVLNNGQQVEIVRKGIALICPSGQWKVNDKLNVIIK